MTDRQILRLIRAEIANALDKVTSFSDDDTVYTIQERIREVVDDLRLYNSCEDGE